MRQQWEGYLRAVAEGPHLDHLLGPRHRPLDDPEELLEAAFEAVAAGRERQQEDVETDEEAGQWPCDEEDQQEPDERVDDAGAAVGHCLVRVDDREVELLLTLRSFSL